MVENRRRQHCQLTRA